MQLENYMLPCLWKQQFGIDCLGCGMQRSLVLIVKGRFGDAFYMYPAIYTLLALFIFLILHIKYKFKIGSKVLLALFIFNTIIIITNYLFKII